MQDLELYSYDYMEGELLLGNNPTTFLLPTCSGKQALDDDALGGIWDGIVEEKRKGSGKESGGRRGEEASLLLLLLVR